MPEATDISRVTSRAGAEDLIASVLSGMRELEATLGAETAQVRVGRIRDGLASEAKKGELAARYLRGLEAVKANAVALARFAPEAVDGLRAAHAGFGRTVEENRIVLATARGLRRTDQEPLGGDHPRVAADDPRPGDRFGAIRTSGGAPRGVAQPLADA